MAKHKRGAKSLPKLVVKARLAQSAMLASVDAARDRILALGEMLTEIERRMSASEADVLKLPRPKSPGTVNRSGTNAGGSTPKPRALAKPVAVLSRSAATSKKTTVKRPTAPRRGAAPQPVARRRKTT